MVFGVQIETWPDLLTRGPIGLVLSSCPNILYSNTALLSSLGSRIPRQKYHTAGAWLESMCSRRSIFSFGDVRVICCALGFSMFRTRRQRIVNLENGKAVEDGDTWNLLYTPPMSSYS